MRFKPLMFVCFGQIILLRLLRRSKKIEKRKFNRKVGQKNIINRKLKKSSSPSLSHTDTQAYQVDKFAESKRTIQMKIHHPSSILCLFLIIEIVHPESEDQCFSNTKITSYRETICQINYQQCPSDQQIQIKQCVGYKCKLQIGAKCYLYSLQNLDDRICIQECCGYQTTFHEPLSSLIHQCLSLQFDHQIDEDEPPSNTLTIVLGSALGVFFMVLVFICICCRRKIKQCWNSNNNQEQNNINPTSQGALSQIESSQIKFIFGDSETNLNYEKEQECTICLSSRNEVKLRCGHWFHLKCVITWFSKSFKCPNCVSEQINPCLVLCKGCQRPYVEMRLSRKSEWRDLRSKINLSLCKKCLQKQARGEIKKILKS